MGREGIDEMIVSVESGTNVIDDHNWNRKNGTNCHFVMGLLACKVILDQIPKFGYF